MKAKKQSRRVLSLVLAAALLLGTIPGRVSASQEETIMGNAETVQVSNTGMERENNFNAGWKFYLGNNSSAYQKNFDDSGWDSVSLPHDFSISQSFTTGGEAESGFLPGGTGWYRKSFTLPETMAGKTFLLNFDGVYMHATVYVNGTQVGEHHYGYTAFAFDITDYLTCDGATENVIAVKAVNNIPSSRWYSGSGIYRDVTLYAMDPVHVDLNGVTVTTPNIASNDGTVQAETTLVNDSSASVSATVTTTVYQKGENVALAAGSSVVTVGANSRATATNSAVVSNPALWSVDSPNLYTLKTEVSVGGTVVDSSETEFGFRWFTFDSTGFHLNGNNVKLNGVCLHHDQGALGSAAYDDAIYRQLTIMKDMGVNAVRTSHNPAAADLIAICNELGLLVIEETFDGLNEAKNSNYNDFSGYFTASADSGLYGYASGMTCAEYAARSMVRRDKNAPSIFAWSFGNEIQEGTNWNNVSQFAGFCQNYINWVNDEDGTRIVTSGDNNRGADSRLVAVLNTIINANGVVGFNYANDLSTVSSLLRSYGGNHNCIILSETSSHTNSRGMYKAQISNEASDGKYHVTSYDTSAVTWGITAHESIYNTYQYDGVAGEFIWTGFDYIGEPTPWNKTESGSLIGSYAYPNSSYFGAVDTAGFAKDTFYLYRSQWNKNATTVHLVTAWDSDNMMTSGGKTPVWLYSNAAKVELYLNGSKIGTATRSAHTSAAGHTYYTYSATSNNTSICSVSNGSGSSALYAVFNVTYTAGTLSTKAYDENGNEITLNDSCGRYTVSTPGTASALQIKQNRTEIAADGSSLVYVEVDVTDANGNPDTAATNSISFTLTGPGEIMGVDNGDQATTAKYQQPSVLTSATSAHINAYAGKALVILRSTRDAGTITLNVTSSGLTGQTVTVTTTGEVVSTQGLTAYSMVRDYTVKVGTVPTLETTATGYYGDNTTKIGTITWDAAPSTSQPGDYTLSGTLRIDGEEPISVTARLHVIADVIALRNLSTATMANTAPTLPSTVRGVLADGTLSGEFTVTWDAPEASAYDTVGKLVTVKGTAAVFGTETLPVTCTVRVAETVNTESNNIAPQVSSLTQDIASGYQSDNLNSINNGTLKPGDNTSERWTNWGNRTNSAEATLTMLWATAHTIGSINIYYYYDNCCAYPESLEFSCSSNGNDYTVIGHTEELKETYTLGALYTYTFDEPVNPVGLKVKFTQQGGTTGSHCVGVTELEVMTYVGTMEKNTSADLSGIFVDGTALEGFQADTLTYEAAGNQVTAETQVNAGITILPVHEDVVRILTVSEDGAAEKTYALTLTQSCAHENTEIKNQKDPTCTVDGYTGDIYCNDCQRVITQGEPILATGHRNTVVQNQKDATCSETGYTGDTWCNDCKQVIETGKSIPTTDHQNTQLQGKKDANCTEDGYTGDLVCTDCGNVVTPGRTIPAAHGKTEVRDAVAASCTAEGYTGDTWCTVCEEKLSSGTTIPMTEHSWDTGVKEDGQITYTCQTCGTTKTEASKSAPELTAQVYKRNGAYLTMVGRFEDFEHQDRYYELTYHGIVYMETARLGTRVLTVNTPGRSRVNFSGYKEDGSFVYNIRPAAKTRAYTVRSFAIYTNPKTGRTETVYSSPVVTTFNKAPEYPY